MFWILGSVIDVNMRRRILKLENDAKLIRRLNFIANTILANACYSEKEETAMINRGEKIGNLNDIEKEMLHKTWSTRRDLANKLLSDLTEVLNETTTTEVLNETET